MKMAGLSAELSGSRFGVHGSKVDFPVTLPNKINGKGKNAKRLTLNREQGTFEPRPTECPIYGQFRVL
jgi:hypothetical protein